MDLSDVVSVQKFQEFKAEQKDELYETLLDLAQAIHEIPKKSLRKTLDITLAVLQYKGKQVEELQHQTSDTDNSKNMRLQKENEELKVILKTLETENQSSVEKLKSLTDEIFVLQQRLNEATANSAEISDKDSSDPLSELDKQEELLRTINTKNKHIKRLLREIEALQIQNIEQSKMIIDLDKQIQGEKAKVLQLSADISLLDGERKDLKETVNKLQVEISRLEGNVTFLEDEREKSEKELMGMIKKLEAKAQSRTKLLEEKNRELKKYHTNRQNKSMVPLSSNEKLTPSTSTESIAMLADNNSYKADSDRETTKMLQAIECRDKLIEQLELKIKVMAEEMLSSTKLMDKISAERLEEQKPRACCKQVEESLQAAKKRCRELSELLDNCEEDNLVKSKQALQATTALDAYQRGEDGLIKALKKCSSLEHKLLSRDKQIQALVAELNSMHELTHENTVLRKRLNIPDDAVIVKNLAAKERSKDKIINRLTLKLRASEEMRLRLKMQNSELRTELINLQKTLQNKGEEKCEDSVKIPSEIGEVEEVKQRDPRAENKSVAYASPTKCSCGHSIEIASNPDKGNWNSSSSFECKYEDNIAENEALRQGMVEILEKLRDYDASSDHITIDTEILLRLLKVLQKPAEDCSRIADSELPKQQPETVTEMDECSSVESVRGGAEVDLEMSILVLDSSTRPTTPNKSLNQCLFPIISIEEQFVPMETQNRDQEMKLVELQVYQQRYEALIADHESKMIGDGEGLSSLEHRITKLEIELRQKTKCYEYLRKDFDVNLTESKQREMQHIVDVTALKTNINGLLEEIAELEDTRRKETNNLQYSEDEYLVLQRANTELQTQVAYIVDYILHGKLSPELQINDICIDYGIIRDNFQLDYLTADEFTELRKRAEELVEEKSELTRKCGQLEGLLEIAHEQIQMQQKLLNDLTDNHINLRHLVADLQSSSEDKLIFAKIQRDLDGAKLEVNNLKLEREQLQQKCVSLEQKIHATQQETAKLSECFEVEQRLKDTKLKFLKKAIFTLKQKYAKFTPLVFLTNYTFSYARFIKRSHEIELSTESVTLNDGIIEEAAKLVSSKVSNSFNDLRDESSILIKLIKAETQNKLLEESLDSLKQSYRDLQEELTKQHMKRAADDEHWKTIEALFSPVTEKPKDLMASRDTEASFKTIFADVATNTETPVPAERHLYDVNSEPRKSPTGGKNGIVDLNEKQQLVKEISTENDAPNFAIAQENIDKRKEKKNHDEEIKEEEFNQSDDDEGNVDFEDKKKVEIVDEEDEINAKSGEEDFVEKGKLEEKEKEKKESLIIQKTDALVQTSETRCVASFGVQTMLTDRERETIEEELQQVTQKLGETQNMYAEIVERFNNTNAELCQAKIETDELRNQIEICRAENIKLVTSESKAARQQDSNQHSDIIEKTILSFHTLLSEKDKSISKYQDLLETEQKQAQESMSKLNQDIKELKSTLLDLSQCMKGKDMEIEELKTSLVSVGKRRDSGSEKPNLRVDKDGENGEGDNSLNEISDEKIEEMFDRDTDSVMTMPLATTTATAEPETTVEEKQDTEKLGEVSTLTSRIKELSDKTCYLENTLMIKDDEINILREKSKLYQEQSKSSMESSAHPEIERLSLLLEEKNQHINELISTLNNFHDDQQRYMNDSTNSTADQMSKLAADLTRNEATNKIYRTQVEALRRQLSNLTEREKHARGVSQSLRNELIKRPVVSIKTELNARAKNENLNKRIQQLELDLEDARVQIQRQNIIIEARKAKRNSEVNLWEKQKRWQQNAEKYKTKLDETECTLEKTKSLLNTARNTITRLEKEKQNLEARMGRGAKYTSSETPETYTGQSSDCSSPAHTMSGRRGVAPHLHPFSGRRCCVGDDDEHHHHNQSELIDALKARSEMQERKIAALELEGKGSNALTTELEKLQEKLSASEAQNIRLEARNLQLQLDNDMLRQGDSSERLQKRNKHLEDYIIALKEEIAQSEARRELCKCSGIKMGSQNGQTAQQTILSLRNIVEKLRSEIKYLKDGRRSFDSKGPIETLTESSRLQSKSLDKISSVQANCPICSNRRKMDSSKNSDELNFIREQLIKKTQLLQKAKVLLTRAAAKEKVLKEQLALWKRKCFELQNVPVIDEISE